MTANSATGTYDGTEKESASGVTGTIHKRQKGAQFTVEGP